MTEKRRLKSREVLAFAFTAAASTFITPPSQAETLKDALTKAYLDNPTLTGARAGQRAQDENVGIAKADGRPSAGVTGSYTEELHRAAPVALTTPGRTAAGQASVDVPLYSGGAVRNAVKAAKLRVESGQNDLRGTESAIFSRVVAAYLDVIRDSVIVTLNAQNVKALEVNLRATSDRFEVGDVTRTDVAQSQSRLALASADFQRAQAQLIASKENYTALVGSPPVNLEPPPPLPGLPDSPEAAVTTALADNPDIKGAHKDRDAARYDVRSTKAQILPRVSAFAQGGYQDFLGSENGTLLTYGSVKSAAAGATLTVPLYQGGRPGALERQAAARESLAIEQAVAVERDVIAQARATYASWQASLQAIESTQAAVDAADLSLRGVKAENSVGTRTILDILDAEREALNARVQLVSARRDAYVAAFSLLAAMGHAEGRDLGIDPAVLYDPAQNYRRVNGKLLDFDYDPHPAAIAKTTSATPVQDAIPIVTPGY
jgi:outer membrane protein